MRFFSVSLRVFDYAGDATTSPGMTVEMKIYYEKQLLKEASPNLIHRQFGDKYPIPKGTGKTIEFRKVSALPKAVTALTEGVTPNPRNMTVTNITATIAQYGDWVQSSDLLELTTIDPVLVQRTEVLGSQAGRTLDSLTRDEMAGGTSVIFCGTDIETREDVTKEALLDKTKIFQAAAFLKAQNAPTFDGDYIGIVHPYVSGDLMNSQGWTDISVYGQPEKIYKGELGRLGGVRFVESSEAKIWAPGVIADGKNRLTVKTAISSSTTSVVVNEVLESATGLNVPVYINGVENTVTAITAGSGQSTLTVATAVTSAPVGSVVCGQGAGKDGSAVFGTIIVGKNAYAVTEVEGGGLQHIVKQLGYGDDPLNQRSSSGWKATAVTKRLNENYMVRLESGSSMSGSVNAN